MVQIDSITFADEYTDAGGGGVAYLLGSIGDKITATINLTIKWNSLNIPVVYSAADKTISRTDNGSFVDDGWHEGDSIASSGTVSNNWTKVVSTVTDTVITLTTAPTNETIVGASFKGVPSRVTAMDFYFNLIENDAPEDFLSLTDNQTLQKFNATGLASGMDSVDFTTPTISKGWINGSASIDDGSSTDYEAKYIITHTFFITPLYLNSQLTNLQNGPPPAPDYFSNGQALKYICKIDAKYDNRNPDIPHTSEDPFQEQFTFAKGNTGWFNEFLNGGEPEYFLISIAYEDADTAEEMAAIDYCKETLVTMRIASANAKFESTDSPFALNFIWLPRLEASYINTTLELKENYKWDRAYLVSSDPPTEINGENFNSDYQVLTLINATMVSDSIMEITFTVNMATALRTFFASREESDLNYLIWITPQDKDVASMATTDRNAVICDVNELACDTDDPTLLIFKPVGFYEHPDYSGVPFSDFKGWPTDTVYAKGDLQVSRYASSWVILQVKIEAEPSDTSKTSFPLESQDFTTSQYEGRDGINEVNIEEQREFRIPATYPWSNMNLVRNENLDDADYVGYTFEYGFKLRHETWVLLQQYYRDFLEDHSEDWSIYGNASGWDVKFNIYGSVTDADGNISEFKHECSLTIKNYEDYYNGITTVIETFVDDEVEGEVDIDGQILKDEYTIVRATFTGDFAAFPAGYDGYYGILYLDIKGSGGINKIDQCSSVETRVADSAWLGYTVDGDNATLTKVNDTTITLEARINYAMLDDNNDDAYLIGARLGVKNSDYRQFSDNEAHLWSDSVLAEWPTVGV